MNQRCDESNLVQVSTYQGGDAYDARASSLLSRNGALAREEDGDGEGRLLRKGLGRRRGLLVRWWEQCLVEQTGAGHSNNVGGDAAIAELLVWSKDGAEVAAVVRELGDGFACALGDGVGKVGRGGEIYSPRTGNARDSGEVY